MTMYSGTWVPAAAPPADSTKHEVLVVGVAVDRLARVERQGESVALGFCHGVDSSKAEGGRGAAAVAGRCLEHRHGVATRPDPPRPNALLDAEHPAVAVEPHQVEREAHTERVDRTASRQQQREPRRRPSAQAHSDQAGAEGVGHDDLHVGLSRARRELAPAAIFGADPPP